MESIENRVFDENVESAREVAVLRRDIITQRRTIWPLRTVIGELEAKLQKFTAMDMTVYFGDILDHLNKIWETLDECKEIIEVFKDTDFVLSTERLNHIMRILTIMSTIILPFLVVSSIYGMNVHLPGGLTSGDHLSFLWLMVFMSLIAIGILYFFHRKHWI